MTILGHWTTYLFRFKSDISSTDKFRDFCEALADHGITIQEIDHYQVDVSANDPSIWTDLEDEIAGTHAHLQTSLSGASGVEKVRSQTSTDSPDKGVILSDQVHLNFAVRYQLEVCLSNGYLKEHTITREFLEELAECDHALALLEKVAGKQRVYYHPMDIFSIHVKHSQRRTPSHCVLARSAVITPTTIHVCTPNLETSNRIIRKYSADADRFIRVKFTDEKTQGLLRNMPNDRAEAAFNRVRRAMRNGIVVAGRFYEFLAYGNSQFRENGAYFYAPTLSKTAEDIRLALGSFDHIRTVAKFGARLGQCFSTTWSIKIRPVVVKIPDVMRNGYCFTDGVGKLSKLMAQMAADELGLSFDNPPSLFQFRLGGCKGVLALDPSITGNVIHIRPSQQKFEAVFNGLEIIRSSSLATPFFNRQIVIVLSNLGVSDQVFIKKQRNMLDDYERAMTDSQIAVQKLQKHIDLNQITLTMASMILDGFMQTREPFLMSLLHLWRSFTIKKLKEKARIAIEDGAFVFGCVDETASLKGHFDKSHPATSRAEKLMDLPEIFLQIDDPANKGKCRVIEGVCVLARNPSLHAGDIRVVRAVDVAMLHHLKNVVVLPQTGDRDLANMCSGGDLDGDDYMVLWDKDLIPKVINVEPLDFKMAKAPESDKPIQIAEVCEFFVTYMKNDTLGQIANAHLAHADHHGLTSEECLRLAELHSQAVDYPKSGVTATMEYNLKPKQWPHFMEKKHLPMSKTRKSKSVLGKLYDEVQLVAFKPQIGSFDTRVLQARNPDNETLERAATLKNTYDDALRRLMAKHGLQTEFEAWSTFALDHNTEIGNDYKFSEEFGRTAGVFKSHYRDLCRSSVTEAGGKIAKPGDEWTALENFVVAMYKVTAEEMEGYQKRGLSDDEQEVPFISFPWLFAAELGKIAKGPRTAGGAP